MEEQPQRSLHKKENSIVLAGASGALGQRIAYHLLQKGATVRALVRKGSLSFSLRDLGEENISLIEVDYNKQQQLTEACAGTACVISALSGLRDVIVDAQTNLLTAAIAAGVPRFIPSDYCIDFTKLPEGSNRNLDLRREFGKRLEAAPIKATSILNGMFTDLLTGQAPVVLFKLKRIVYWGNAEQLLDFTTMDNTAAFTAAAALDSSTPRFLCIAGEVTNARGLMKSAEEATGKEFHLLRAGGLGMLKTMIGVTRTLMPKNDEVFPPWQGMQYLHNMFTGLPKFTSLDNNRYPEIKWTSVKEVLQGRSS